MSAADVAGLTPSPLRVNAAEAAIRLDGRYGESAREALGELYAGLRAAGCTAPATAEGQLIRPLLSLAGAAAAGGEPGAAEWAALAAVQLAHEASLVHDDVVDGAAERRSRPTLVAARGVAAALVEGDHLLTTAYRLAASTGSLPFVEAFALAVERTVAGEKLQGRMTGELLDEGSYRRIVGMKSGELLGCALAAAAYVRGRPEAASLHVLGRRLGTLYQMLDDLLDYCPGASTGKPALGDLAQRRWTWPLLELPTAFDMPPAEVPAAFLDSSAGLSPMRRCLRRLDDEAAAVRTAVAVHLPGDNVINALIADWQVRAAAAVTAAETAHAAEQARLSAERDRQAAARARRSIEAHVQPAADAAAYFRRHSRTFSFAARLFPAHFRRQVTAVYAFCRLTDDLADEGGAEPLADRLARIDAWERLARQAYDGDATGIAVVDEAMTDAARAGVPFHCVAELVAGMRMDLTVSRYPDHPALRVYSYRVAGVVGEWLTYLCGIRDRWMLERAAALGHAMQLTNILRDVGEDLGRGRVYLPADILDEYGITTDTLHSAMSGPLPAGYRDLLEVLMARADSDYAAALEAAPRLPPWFRRAVVVAAHVYRGIHDEIRRNGYDNLSRRAHTSPATRVRLMARALAGMPLGDMPLTASPAATPVGPGLPGMVHTGTQPGRRTVVRPPVTPAGQRSGSSYRPGPATLPLLAAALLTGAPLYAADGVVHGQSAPLAAAADAAPRSPAVHLARLEREHAMKPDAADVALDLVRALFFAGVDDDDAADRGPHVLDHIHTHAPEFAADNQPLLDAYRGGFAMLEAKHGHWPHARLRAVRQGLALLDRAVADAPGDVEVRYLRWVSTHYLPGIFRRRETASRDRVAVQRLLPAEHTLHPDMRAVISAFLRETS
ncbi:MAG TPA: squalene/phytoene synthase family protein [Longimicrobiales bacterium]|nr:squalene/phytoene synthase family protein [Longimicrobiales bacterium]